MLIIHVFMSFQMINIIKAMKNTIKPS